ncbi:MAG TPA: DegV family protein, partial [Anaerolineaceae bacterium]|nr:DegV family protein [Anaerolineaceae bacterium]
MSKIAIITDTDSSLPAELAAQHGIRLIPITVHFGEESYISGVNLDDVKLFEMIDARKKLPTTSAPSPNSFIKAFQAAFDAGAEQIICICVSSKISATYQSAMTALEMFPGKDITILDALNLCMAQGFMALAAAEAAARGASKEEIL